MNKDDKHNLSPEELFNLLDITHSGSTGDLDDFEKEALEGFALLDNKQEARGTYQSVLSKLSKKNAGQTDDRKKVRIIWFSAAAGLILVLGLFFILFNNYKDVAPAPIAINNPPPVANESQPLASPIPNLPGADIQTKTGESLAGDNLYEQKNELALKDNELAFRDEEKSADDIQQVTREVNLLAKQMTEASNKKVDNTVPMEETPKTVVTDIVATNSNGRLFNEGISAGMTPADYKKEEADPRSNADGKVAVLEKSKEKADKDQENDVSKGDVSANISTAALSDASTSSPQATTQQSHVTGGKDNLRQKDEGAKESAKKEEKTKYRSTTVVPVSGTQQNNSVNLAASKAAQTSTAYYEGGEKAIKTEVLKKADTQTTAKLKGSYSVKARVSKDGNLKVLSIINTTSDCKDCVSLIESILNKLTGWHPAVQNGNAIASEVLFKITF